MRRLHVNIDHIATLRQARREAFPDPVEWAVRCLAAGADGITLHLRKDRRHIQDEDVVRMRAALKDIINLELSLDEEMVQIGLKSRAEAFCLVPENRQEITTEGGLDVRGEQERLRHVIPALQQTGGLVSLFIDPVEEQVVASSEAGADFIELHTGTYANSQGDERLKELKRIEAAAQRAVELGLRVNAGHGLDYDNVQPVAALPMVEELNIGFAIVARAVTTGVDEAVSKMRELIQLP